MTHPNLTRSNRVRTALGRIAGQCALAATVGGACACGGSPEARPDDSVFLAVGADPVAVVDEATTRLGGLGLGVEARIDSPAFSAASFRGADARTAIRVATRRGLALALDAQADEGLLGLDPRTGTDLDGDGAPDLVLVRQEAARACLALARVDPEGVLRPVATDPRGLDPEGCIERLEQLDHDGRVEAIVVQRAPALGTPPPSVAEPLTLRADGAFARGTWPTGYAARETEAREASLERALERGEPSEAVRLAIELAWIGRARGADVAEVDARLDLASRVPLPPDEQARLVAARQFLLAAVPSPADDASSASASASE